MKITLAAVLCMAAALLWRSIPGGAATPSSGTLTPTSGTLTYSAGPFLTPNVTSNIPGNNQPECTDLTPCDDYNLTVDLSGATQEFLDAHRIEVTISWPLAQADFDLYVLKGAAVIKDAATSADPEIAVFDPEPNVNSYTVRVAPFAPAGQSFEATIRFIEKAATPTATPTPPPPGGGPNQARFQTFLSPTGVGDDWGEPSIGANWQTGKIMTYGGFSTYALRVGFDDCASPAKVTWTQTPLTLAATIRALGDPILWTDKDTGRTLVSQLEGGTKQSTTDYTEDDGDNYQPTQGAGINSGVDHQTLGGGPFALGAPPHIYENAVYYCAQDVADANCALSIDGGITFGPAVPIYTVAECGGIHGHVKVAPDGTVYVPNKGCGGTPIGRAHQGVAVSEDNGITWVVHEVEGTTPSSEDPSIGIASDGTLYFGYADGDGHPKAVVSHDKGVSWSTPVDLGATFGIQHTVFPVTVAGDPLRAAVGFLGTPATGNPNDAETFKGIWHLYVATTYDGGANWATVDATPDDPVQVGSICRAGTTCGADRNLLDFNDATIDKEGRVLIGYADGCVAPACTAATAAGEPPYDTSRSSKAVITRQSGGKRMFALYDPNPPEPSAPAAPRVDSVNRDGAGVVHVRWSEPDNGGSPLTGYNIYRRIDLGTYGAPLATVSAVKTTYDDLTADATVEKYYYEVKAVNAIGEGTNCGEFLAEAPPDPCTPPGIQVLADPTGDGFGLGVPSAQPPYDIQAVGISEPYQFGPDKLVFTIKMRDLSVLPPSARWPVQFKAPDNKTYVVAMLTNATSQVSFKYGEGTTSTANPANTADPASNYTPNGFITIVVPRSGIGNPAVGQKLNSFLMRATESPGVTPDNCPDDLTPSGEYTIVGNAACRPNVAPIPVLAANPRTGKAPLMVNFDASGSHDPDADAPPDTIASYTFVFGDGSPSVTQSSPTISHTYTKPGEYAARLTVKDSRGKTSSNGAEVVIRVLELSSFTLSPPSLTGGCGNSQGTITLSGPAPSGGLVVSIINNNTSAATAPTSVKVPAGATTRTFAITTNGVPAERLVKITARLGPSSMSQTLKVLPMYLADMTLKPNPVKGGQYVSGLLVLECRAPAGGLTVALSSTRPSIANPTASSVTIPGGTKSATFRISTTKVTTSYNAVIKATANGKAKTQTLTIKP